MAVGDRVAAADDRGGIVEAATGLAEPGGGVVAHPALTAAMRASVASHAATHRPG
jgi:hypothetical protein